LAIEWHFMAYHTASESEDYECTAGAP
jgi:hypothetical protein